MLAALGAILGGFAAVISAIYAGKAVTASREAKRGELDVVKEKNKIDAVEVSITSLTTALQRADGERKELRQELLDAKAEHRKDIDELRERFDREQEECNKRVERLLSRVAELEAA